MNHIQKFSSTCIKVKHLLLLVTGLVIIFSCSTSRAETVTYELENIVMTNGLTITGTFVWTYPTGDFENGSGQFTEILIPGYGSDISGLNLTIDLADIEITMVANLHDKGLDIILRLLTDLSATQPSLLDLSIDINGVYASKYELIGYVGTPFTGGFVSGSITPLLPVLGDLNADRLVNAADILIATQIVSGQRIPSTEQTLTMDVAPNINGIPSPDGILDTADILLIERKVLGTINF